MAKRGLLIVLSGPSGVGKGTVKKLLLNCEDNNLVESISATTRKPREGEIDGISYYFLSEKTFSKYIEEDRFVEYCGNFEKRYGTLKSEVIKRLEEGKNVLLEIDVKGGIKVKKAFPEAVMIMLAPPAISILKERLIGRNTESNEEIERRFSIAKNELEEYNKYDYVVINDEISKAVKDIENIISACSLKKERFNLKDIEK